MTGAASNVAPDWVRAARMQAQRPPLTPRVALHVQGHVVGSVDSAVLAQVKAQGLLDPDLIRRRTPMGRLIAPEEIAEAVWFLASPAASAITGAVLTADAGWSAFGAAGDAFSAEARS